jgi:hypothetical protein
MMLRQNMLKIIIWQVFQVSQIFESKARSLSIEWGTITCSTQVGSRPGLECLISQKKMSKTNALAFLQPAMTKKNICHKILKLYSLSLMVGENMQ